MLPCPFAKGSNALPTMKLNLASRSFRERSIWEVHSFVIRVFRPSPRPEGAPLKKTGKAPSNCGMFRPGQSCALSEAEPAHVLSVAFSPEGKKLAGAQAFIPPSTVRFAPVMYEDSGPATNATIAATSSTCP
ncbi:MAG: hypothetical protein QOG23_2354 [Blastocatellia bacterium]|nr:hypothetical protein [Blastocatellia bacterium]